MTKILTWVVCLMVLAYALLTAPGCILMSDAYYEAKIHRHDVNKEILIAHSQNANKPIAEFTTSTGEKIVVNNQNATKPMIITADKNVFVESINAVTGLANSAGAKIVGGGFAGALIAREVQGVYNANSGGKIDVTRDSGNTNSLESEVNNNSGDGSLTKNTDAGNTSGSHNIDDHRAIDNSAPNNSIDNSATATPTIVEQPSPIIVEQPEPIIVEQPEPVIVEQTNTTTTTTN